MLLVKMAYSNEQNFIESIQEIRDILRNKGYKIGISEFMENNTHFIKIFCDDNKVEEVENIKKTFLVYMSNAIYRLIISKYREKELLEYLTENYFFLKHTEVIEVDKKINKFFRQDGPITSDKELQCVSLILKIEKIINDFIEEDNFINIDGFLRFRLKSIRPIIEEIVDKLIEEYMVEKEYNEFINLLRYFVDIQESKIDEVHIYINENGEYYIKDKNGENIFNKFLDELIESNEADNINNEDIIISGLITNSPKYVNIHNEENCKNKEFLNTISKVFRERVVFIEGKNIL
ncbi:MAG: putative sporulation protein YtxC [Sarcina sp.]